MQLSVSSGDSGGGIFRTGTNEVISTVCCTTGVGRQVSMYGASTEAILRARPTSTTLADEWAPIAMPIRRDETSPPEVEVEWIPLQIPIRDEEQG